MSLTLILSWYALGLIGATVVWAENLLEHAMIERAKPVWCPTPRAIVGILFFGIGGPGPLFVGLVLMLVRVLTSKRTNSWWARPICKPKDTK